MKIILRLFILSLLFIAKLYAQEIEALPRVNFIINENYLVTHTLSKGSSGNYHDDIIALQNLAWDMDEVNYAKAKHFGKYNLDIFHEDKIPADLLVFIQKIKQTAEYQKILLQTQDYLQESLREWNANLNVTTTLMSHISGLNFLKGIPFTVYITHPASGNGSTWSQDQRIISFGAWSNFPNYFTVYIWHEMLHTFLPLDGWAHSTIQLATDNWLREMLNHENNTPLIGHEYLIPMMTKLKPSWEEYLKAPDSFLLFYQRSLGVSWP